MRNVKMPGGAHDVGSAQGYEGVSVLFTTESVQLEGRPPRDVAVYKLAYQLDPDEVRALLEGGRVVLTVIGTPPIVPHRLEVQST